MAPHVMTDEVDDVDAAQRTDCEVRLEPRENAVLEAMTFPVEEAGLFDGLYQTQLRGQATSVATHHHRRPQTTCHSAASVPQSPWSDERDEDL